MAQFKGSLNDFHILVGPKVRNDVATITKKTKNELNSICQHCNEKRELDAAHIHGRSRKDIIKIVLEPYKIDDNTYSIQNLHNVLTDIKVEHLPVRDNFYFLCKECHKKYDNGNKPPKTILETKHEYLTSHPVSSDTLNTDVLPHDGDEFTEKQLYEKFQVRNSGGIRPTVKNKAIILINSFFSEHMGGYKDHGDEKEGFVYYVGEGEGDQDFVRNNKSILESQYNGYALLYFEKHVRDKLVFRYQLEYDSWTHEMQANSKGQNRQVIVFKLKII